jgi:hypothetical protein
MMASLGEFGPRYVPKRIDVNPDPDPKAIADEATARRFPNAKTRKRLGLPKPQHVPIVSGKRYRRKKEST